MRLGLTSRVTTCPHSGAAFTVRIIAVIYRLFEVYTLCMQPSRVTIRRHFGAASIVSAGCILYTYIS